MKLYVIFRHNYNAGVFIGICVCVKGSSSAQPPKEAAKDARPREAPSKSSGSSSKGPDKKFEFSFNLAKYVHCAVVFRAFCNFSLILFVLFLV